jgi:hypothetical protein
MRITKALTELCKERERIVREIQDLEHVTERPRPELVRPTRSKTRPIRAQKSLRISFPPPH